MTTVRVSASQIQLASLCWRKWAFAYIRGLREPETRALALGTKVHAILEAYLRDGTVPDPNETWSFPGETRTFYPGKIALNMMPAGLFPAPGVGKVEHRFEWHNDGIIWNGLVDWHAFNPTAPPAEFEELPGRADTGLIVVIDHKTSSDPVKWGKTASSVRPMASMLPAGRFSVRRPEVVTSDSASSSDRTPARQAATYS
ncbi:MAG: PD-(D/E)XK nuclease family protein, partial [Planctomycetota bacterium]|nr:PD-(D/E)XK nuclease family protein [Planctomycetota bacterium]